MSLATIPRRRGRRPKLKVVGGEPRPRNRIAWRFHGVYHASLEFWSFEEWSQLAEYEHPERVVWLPGVGVFHIQDIDGEACEEIWEEVREKREAHNFLRGLGD